MPPRLACDSNVLTYFLEANCVLGYEPEKDVQTSLAAERVAAFRLFLCYPLFIVPSVALEAKNIRDEQKRDEHLRFIWHHFEEVLEERLDTAEVNALTTKAEAAGASKADARVLAEATAAGMDALVTFDKGPRRVHANGLWKMSVLSPVACWQRYAVPIHLARWVPAAGHPLAAAEWWRW